MASRICHDIVNPLGAIANGLELLELSGFPRTEEFKLVQTSVEAANRRVKMLRMAFGRVQEDRQTPFEQLKAHIATVFERQGFTINIQFNNDLPQVQAQTLLLGCLCVADSLPYGGNVTIVPDRITFSSESKVMATLFDKPEDLNRDVSPEQAHFAHLHTIFEEKGSALDVETKRKERVLHLALG